VEQANVLQANKQILNPARFRTVVPGRGILDQRREKSESIPFLREDPFTNQVTLAIVLLPGFSLYELSALCDTFSAANVHVKQSPFTWHLIGLDEQPVRCSLGTVTHVRSSVGAAAPAPNIFILAGSDLSEASQLKSWLRRAITKKSRILASGSAVTFLAQTGLLSGKACAVHWSFREAFNEQWPDIDTSDQLYTVQGQYVTCAGGTALIDLALACIADRLGDQAAKQIAHDICHPRFRKGDEIQSASPQGALFINNIHILKAIERIDANLMERLTAKDLAATAGVGERQLQRLFKHQLRLSPSRFALIRRLQKARRLLRQTDLSITEIGLATGFTSLSYFSRTYSIAFGRVPRRDRSASSD